jgi:N-acetylmuramoyl-L-alanine amidase
MEATILLDNGHGENTAGKRSPKLPDGKQIFEYEFNRDIVNRVHERLQAFGVQSIILVPEKTDVSLTERYKRANKYASLNPILISVHANAFGDGTTFNDANGWEAYTTPGLTQADYLCKFMYQAATEVFGTTFDIRDKQIYSELPSLPGKEADFAILRGSTMPAVLTENLFMTNSKEAKFMMSEEGRNIITELHFRAIFYYMHWDGDIKLFQ